MKKDVQNLREIAKKKLIEWSEGTRWKQWNIECLVLHEILKEHCPEYARGVLNDNVTFVLIPRNEDKNEYQRLGNYEPNDNDIVFKGDFWQCIDYIEENC